jgi:hypothetical protein
MPMLSPTATRIGSDRVAASTRGTARYFIGLVESVVSASICSVTFMVPISAAMAAATRPATMRPPRTGPSSRVMPMATIWGTTASALKREPPAKICSASAPPVKRAVRPTTGRESQPM